MEVVFLNKGEPDLEFEGLLKREHTRVQYFKWVQMTELAAADRLKYVVAALVVDFHISNITSYVVSLYFLRFCWGALLTYSEILP